MSQFSSVREGDRVVLVHPDAESGVEGVVRGLATSTPFSFFSEHDRPGAVVGVFLPGFVRAFLESEGWKLAAHSVPSSFVGEDSEGGKDDGSAESDERPSEGSKDSTDVVTFDANDPTGSVLIELAHERGHQHDLGYGPAHDDHHGLVHILNISESYKFVVAPTSKWHVMRRFLLKRAATLVAAIEYIDRRLSTPGPREP